MKNHFHSFRNFFGLWLIIHSSLLSLWLLITEATDSWEESWELTPHIPQSCRLHKAGGGCTVIGQTAFTWARRAALSGRNGGVATGRHWAGDEGTHLLSVVTVALPATIMPALLIFMMMAIHGQTRAWQDRRPGRSRDLWTDRRQPGKETARAREKQFVVPGHQIWHPGRTVSGTGKAGGERI